MSGPLVDHYLDDLSVLTKVLFTTQCSQKVLFLNARIQPSHINQVSLNNTHAGEVFLVDCIQLPLLSFKLALLIGGALLPVLFGLEFLGRNCLIFDRILAVFSPTCRAEIIEILSDIVETELTYLYLSDYRQSLAHATNEMELCLPKVRMNANLRGAKRMSRDGRWRG